MKKCLYGLKQSPRQWNLRFDAFIRDKGFTRCIKDPCVYLKGKGAEESIYLLLYVDDMLIAAKDKKKVSKLKDILKKEFEMKELGPATRILGMDITRDRVK